MHRLTEIELNFNCTTLARAQWFNDSAEQLWQQELLPVAQQVLDEFDVAAEVQLDEICLQLPPLCLPEDRYLLQHCFRQALRTQLWLLLPQATSVATEQQQQLTAAQRNSLITALKSADTAALTLHWPLYRRFASELVLLLRQLAASGDICTVLAFGLSSEMLAELVQLLAPTEQRFVLQLMAQPQLFAITPARLSGAARQQAQLPAPALRQRQRHLWQLSLSYLLVERGSRFNRQSYLHYLLQRMAAHDNVSLQSLVQHMLLTLKQSQRYFAAHSPLLQQLTELLQPLLVTPQPGRVNTTAAADLAYFSQRRALTAAALPTVKRHNLPQLAAQRRQTQLNPARRWQQWQYLLRLNRLTLAQQRQFNALLQQLLQQNSGLWLEQLRQQLQQLSLLPSLVQYAQPELLQRLFQQLQPASVAAITPYVRLLHWALAAISLPLPLQQHAKWQPLLQCALQRQPLTLNVLLVQLQLWLQAQQGAVAGRQTLQQVAGQLPHYGGTEVVGSAVSTSSSQSQVALLWQQLQWQLAVTAPWSTVVRPLLPGAPTVATHAESAAVAKRIAVSRSSAGYDVSTPSERDAQLPKPVLAAQVTKSELAGQIPKPAPGAHVSRPVFAGHVPTPALTAQVTQCSLPVAAVPKFLLKPTATKAYNRVPAAASAAGPLWQHLVQLLVQTLPASIRQQAQQLCQQVVAQCVPAAQRLPLSALAFAPAATADIKAAQRHSAKRSRRRQAHTAAAFEADSATGSTSDNAAGSASDSVFRSASGDIAASNAELLSSASFSGSLFSSTLLSTLAAALAPACTAVFYRQLHSKLQQNTPGPARNLLMRQLQRLLQYVAPNPLQLQSANVADGRAGEQQSLAGQSGELQSTTLAATVLSDTMAQANAAQIRRPGERAPQNHGWQRSAAKNPAPQNQAAQSSVLRSSALQNAALQNSAIQNPVLQKQADKGQTAAHLARQRDNHLLHRQQGDTKEEEMQPAESMQLVSNAGLVLAAPYLPLLWQRLGWLEAQRFSRVQYAWQACALLHYMATGETTELITADYWQQWRLGMLLNGLQPPCQIDVNITLSSAQRELADSLLAGILAQWSKLGNSSTDTLRECFLQRAGSLIQLGNGSGWQLQLDSGPYDMLLDGLPWSFSLVCYPWMQGELYVHWRG